MHQVYVKFSSAEQVRNFVNKITLLEGDFDLGAGHRIVDAKSIIGVLALDLSQPQRLCYNSEDDFVKEKLKPFLAG